MVAINYYLNMNQNDFQKISNNVLKYIRRNEKNKVKDSGYKIIFNKLK